MGKGKRKGARMKHSNSHQDMEDGAFELSKVSGEEIASPSSFHDNTSSSLCCVSLLGQSESSNYDVAADVQISQWPSDGGNTASSTGITCDADEEQVFEGISEISSAEVKGEMENSAKLVNFDALPSTGSSFTDATFDHNKKECNGRLQDCECSDSLSAAYNDREKEKYLNDYSTEQPCVPDSVARVSLFETLEHDGTGSFSCSDDVWNWMVYWDTFYCRSYFYNMKTQASTWFPPPGMEHLACGDINNGSNEVITEVTEMDGILTEKIGSCDDPVMRKQKKKERRTRRKTKWSSDNEGLTHSLSLSLIFSLRSLGPMAYARASNSLKQNISGKCSFHSSVSGYGAVKLYQASWYIFMRCNFQF